MRMGISTRAYARHRGVSDAAVRKAISAGRITPESDARSIRSLPTRSGQETLADFLQASSLTFDLGLRQPDAMRAGMACCPGKAGRMRSRIRGPENEGKAKQTVRFGYLSGRDRPASVLTVNEFLAANRPLT
jgi:hypothetical protein